MSKIPKTAKSRLTKMNLNRVDLVPQGADSEAFITLFKNKKEEPIKEEGGNKAMTYEELMKSLSEEDAKLINSKIEEITKAKDSEISAVKEELEKAKEVPQEVPENETELEKAIRLTENEEVKAILIKQKEELEKVEIAKAKEKEEALAKEAKSVVEEIAICKAVEGYEDLYISLTKEGKTDVRDSLTELLKSVDEIVEESEIMKEFGSDNEGDSDMSNEEKLDKLAKARAKEEKISFEKAYTMVMKENPELVY